MIDVIKDAFIERGLTAVQLSSNAHRLIITKENIYVLLSIIKNRYLYIQYMSELKTTGPPTKTIDIRDPNSLNVIDEICNYLDTKTKTI